MPLQNIKYTLEQFQAQASDILTSSEYPKPLTAATIGAVQRASSLAALTKAINVAIIQSRMTREDRADLDGLMGVIKLQYPDEYPGITR